jgi:hypothetical protein
MSEFFDPFFPHRKNCDGSYDSICLTCFETVATGTPEELVKREKEHVCGPVRLVSKFVSVSQQKRLHVD